MPEIYHQLSLSNSICNVGCSDSSVVPYVSDITLKKKEQQLVQVVETRAKKMEARTGFEPVNVGFADPCLTTWLSRPFSKEQVLHNPTRSPFPVKSEKMFNRHFFKG